MKVVVFMLGLLLVADVQAQSQIQSQSSGLTPDQPPFALTLAQAKAWTPHGATASKANISQVPLAARLPAPLNSPQALNQRSQALNQQAQLLYAPDGMNNFGNYLQAQPKANLYSFSNWSQIDILNWFAGTADLTVQIPARPWVETAHKNGVKVLGSVFLGIAQWGGSPDTVEKLLEQDAAGNFIVADQLLRIAAYYGFDGWLVNQETDLTVVKDAQNQLVMAANGKPRRDKARGEQLAAKMLAFMQYLTAKAPAGIDIHWYDAMIADGTVHWQNELNAKNQAYLKTDAAPAGSHAMFLNYWWNGAMVRQSVARAKAAGLSPYQLFFGVDLWPERDAQQAFVQTQWLQDLRAASGAATGDAKGVMQTSIALFAPNVNFNFSGNKTTPAYSTFAKDPQDIQRFYQTEQRLFAGDDLNQAKEDSGNAWPGVGAYLPAKTVLTSLPFVTNFNTGQGLYWFEQGQRQRAPFLSDAPDASAKDSAAPANTDSGWTDISQQDILPTWQFALQGKAAAASTLRYDFNYGWSGGSSLLLQVRRTGDLTTPLYQFALTLPATAQLQLQLQTDAPGAIELLLQTDKAVHRFPLGDTALAQQWQSQLIDISALKGQQLQRLSLALASARPAKLQFRLGQIALTDTASSGAKP
jgi:endo-beta-N-acetylglucosaminidase D